MFTDTGRMTVVMFADIGRMTVVMFADIGRMTVAMFADIEACLHHDRCLYSCVRVYRDACSHYGQCFV